MLSTTLGARAAVTKKRTADSEPVRCS